MALVTGISTLPWLIKPVWGFLRFVLVPLTASRPRRPAMVLEEATHIARTLVGEYQHRLARHHVLQHCRTSAVREREWRACRVNRMSGKMPNLEDPAPLVM